MTSIEDQATAVPDPDEDPAATDEATEAEEVAPAILWLLSDAASYTAGTILRVGGAR